MIGPSKIVRVNNMTGKFGHGLRGQNCTAFFYENTEKFSIINTAKNVLPPTP